MKIKVYINYCVVKITLAQMIALLILFYYNDVSMLLASFSSYK